MTIVLLEVDLSLDLTALDGAEVLVLPAVELGEHADHPHVVNLGVALPLIVLFALHGSDCSELSKEQGGEISDLVLAIAQLARVMMTLLKVMQPRTMMMMTLLMVTRPSMKASAMARCRGVLAMARRRKMAAFSMETLTTPRSSL